MYEEIYKVYKKVSKDYVNRELFDHSTESPEEYINDIKKHKLVIYTAFTGNYDNLKEPEFIDENCDYVCFTDNPNLKSDVWKIIQMDESYLDNNRRAKVYKVLPHLYFPDYKYSFWLDGTFKIKGSIREYIYKYIKANSPMLNVIHTERDCIYDEYLGSKPISRYPRAVMEEQVETYRAEGFPEHYGLGVLGAIFREHNNPIIIKVMEDWWNEIVRFTNQDQLSFSYVNWKNNFHPSVSRIYYWDNEYWAKEGKYHHNVIFNNPMTSENLINHLKEELKGKDYDDTLELSKAELYILLNDIKALDGFIDDLNKKISKFNTTKEGILSSKSFKITSPLRSAVNFKKSFMKNPYFILLAHSKGNFFRDLNIYNKIKNSGIFVNERYFMVHPKCKEEKYDPILNFMYFTSETDDLYTKMHYIDQNVFDFAYYANKYDVKSDPLIHFVRRGFDLNYHINPNDKGFIKSSDKSYSLQLEEGIDNLIKKELNSNRYITNSDILIPYLSSKKTYNTDTIKVGVFLEDTFESMNACPFLRIHKPLESLSNSNDYHFFVYGKDTMLNVDLNNIINSKIFDVIVIQRTPLYSKEIVKKAKKHGIKIIFETDDDFLDIDSYNPSFEYFKQNEELINLLVDNADAFTVSTNSLKEVFENNNYENIHLIKNYYAYDSLPPKPVQSSSNLIRIGYFGTLTHEKDLNLIHNAILDLNNEFKDKDISFKLEVAGGLNSTSDWFDTISIPYYPIPFDNFMKWLYLNTNWDIGIVPLEDTKFNSCKSELKYIEFTALGVPVVASNVGTYKEAIKDNCNGFLASNREEWVSKLKKLILDVNLRKSITAKAREDLINNYNLFDRVKQWDNLFKSLLD